MGEPIDLFRQGKYEEALTGYLEAWERIRNSENPDHLKQTLLTLARIIDCCALMLHMNPSVEPAKWRCARDLAIKHFSDYVENLKKSPKTNLAEHVVMDVYGRMIALLFFPGVELREMASAAECLGHFFEQLLESGKGKIRRDYGYSEWLGTTERIRREGTNRPELLNVLRRIRDAFVENIEAQPDSQAYGRHRATMDNLIADSVYFFPETGVAAQQRWAEVERYLKDSLAADPGNLFASEFLANIAQVRNTSAQIRGFLHDLNSNIGGVKVRISELRKITAGSAEAELELDALSDAIQTLLSIATLTLSIEGKKPEEPPAEDLEDEDVAQVVSRAAELLGFKNVDVSYTGIPAKWPMWPALVRLAIGNLIRNADEAYHRRGKGYSGCPVSFFVDYVKKHVFCEDNAGGITPGLESTLFDPYVSEKGVTSNVGLGLSQARSAMLVQGFNLTLPCDQPRGGARFLLDFNERN